MAAKIINNIPILKYINKDNFLEKVESKNYPICLKKKDDLLLHNIINEYKEEINTKEGKKGVLYLSKKFIAKLELYLKK